VGLAVLTAGLNAVPQANRDRMGLEMVASKVRRLMHVCMYVYVCSSVRPSVSMFLVQNLSTNVDKWSNTTGHSVQTVPDSNVRAAILNNEGGGGGGKSFL